MTYQCFSSEPWLEQLCSVQIQARCVSKSVRLTPKELENLELTVEDRVSRSLVQLLGAVEVERLDGCHRKKGRILSFLLVFEDNSMVKEECLK